MIQNLLSGQCNWQAIAFLPLSEHDPTSTSVRLYQSAMLPHGVSGTRKVYYYVQHALHYPAPASSITLDKLKKLETLRQDVGFYAEEPYLR